MRFYVYIIYSASRDVYYIGQTDDLEKRLATHNAGRNRSTRSGLPWILKYYKEYDTRSEAMCMENALKRKKSRKYLEWLIIEHD